MRSCQIFHHTLEKVAPAEHSRTLKSWLVAIIKNQTLNTMTS
jgi:hypothetical protein